MKKYVEVFWAPYKPQKYDLDFDLAYEAPKSLFAILKKERGAAEYLRCPALIETFKNDFAICAPYDLNITIDYENKKVITDRFGENFYAHMVANRADQFQEGNPYLFTIPVRYFFYSYDDVELEMRDVPIINPPSAENYKMIPGGFNISKWYRPIELAVEVKDCSKPISLRVGDPLFVIRLKTPNDVPVKFTRTELTPELLKVSHACTSLKIFRPNLKLPVVYEMAKERIKMFRNLLNR